MALDNAVVIAQGKGGVGKTSLAANLAGLAAHQAGARVLLVDLDQQGNLSRDLGVPRNDGTALFQPLTGGHVVPVTPDARPNLALVPRRAGNRRPGRRDVLADTARRRAA